GGGGGPPRRGRTGRMTGPPTIMTRAGRPPPRQNPGPTPPRAGRPPRPARPDPPQASDRAMPPATTNKQQLLEKSLRLLEKKFPVPPEPPKRPVMEELLYAICREGVPTAQADAAFKRIKDSFFDWNEVRVSTVPEVAEALAGLPDA